MRINHIMLVAAACLCIAGCKSSTTYPKIKSIEVQYPSRAAYTETFSFRYDSEGRLTQVEQCAVYDGEKHMSSWKYAYNPNELKATAESKLWSRSRTGEMLFQDDYSHVVSYSLPEETEMDEYGIVFLGQLWECTYDAGRLTRCVFSDFTSDGMDISKLTWDEDGELLKYEGSDPSVFTEIKDIEYLESDNPFAGPDPVAFAMGISPFYWQGLAGPRPSHLVGGYTHVASDPWVEDVSIDHIAITYENDLDGRISHILQTVNGILEKVVIISY